MNPRLILLVLCLAANVLLAAVLVRQSLTVSRPATAPATTVSTPDDSLPTATTAFTTDQAAPIVSRPDFSWAQIYAADFALYIEQLRGFGTPEPKIREIIFGAVESIYRPKRAALRPPVKKPDDSKFWERRRFFSSMQQGTKEQRAQLRALHEEEKALLKALLGEDVYELMAKESGNTWAEKNLAYIPKELREQVQKIEQEMNEARQEIYAANEGNFDSYQQADLKKVEKKYHDELAKILTPEQLLEWDLRQSQGANQLKNELSAFDPNEDEFRALFQYKQALDELQPTRDPDSDPPQPTAEERKALAEKQKVIEAELALAVGADRVKEYKLEQDYAYRSLIESGVPKASVFALDDMKKSAQDAANKIRKDTSLSAEQRTAALAAIRAETQTSMNGLLDDKQVKRYMSQGGWWLNSIAPVTPKP